MASADNGKPADKSALSQDTDPKKEKVSEELGIEYSKSTDNEKFSTKIEEQIKELTSCVMAMTSRFEDRINALELATQYYRKPGDRIPQKFHTNLKGKRIQFTSGYKTAARIITSEDSLYGGVISARPLCDDYPFMVRIDEVGDLGKDHGIAVGLISCPDSRITTAKCIKDLEATSCIYTSYEDHFGYSQKYKNGKLVSSPYPLDLLDLFVGNSIGILRRNNGDVHFILNGIDKGVAFQTAPEKCYAFFDICNNVYKISIVD